MIRRPPLFPVFLLLVLIVFQLQQPSFFVSSFNVSFIINSFIEGSSAESDSGLDPHPSHILQDVLKVIAKRKKWDLEAIRVSKLEKARYAHFQRHEFRYRIGKRDLIIRLSEKLGSWRSFDGPEESFNFAQLVQQANSVADLAPFEVEGPVELLILGENRASLQLPQNTTLTGLKRVLVGEGITLQITGAQEVSLLHGSCSGIYKGSSDANKQRAELLPFEHLVCLPLFPVHISGSASFTAYRTRNSASSIEANFLSEDTVELNPEKCYPDYMCEKPHCPISSLSSTIASMEKLLSRLLGERIHRSGNQYSSSVRVNVKASTMVTFRMVLERDVSNSDAMWEKVAEWRTKPKVELVWFDVMARFDGYRLHPLEIKKVKPFIGVDTAAWSNVLLNMSLTKFPMFLIPPQSLTLDVNW